MRARPMRDTRPVVEALLKANPDVSYARIGRAVGYTGQMVGVIARTLGLPSRGKGGGFNTNDDADLVWPPGVRLPQKEMASHGS
jgi:hypothetical protein